MRRYLRDAFHIETLPATCAALVLIIASLILAGLTVAGALTQHDLLSGIFVILALYATASVLERVITLGAIRQDIRSLKTNSMDLRSVNECTSIEQFLYGAKDVLLIGLNKAGFFLDRVQFFVALIKSGCSIRLLTLDADDVELYRVVAANLEVDADRVVTDARLTEQTLEQIRNKLDPDETDRLITQVHSAAPGMGLVIVDGGQASGRLQAYFYAYQADPPTRPAVEVARDTDPEWFRFFRELGEKMWHDALIAPRYASSDEHAGAASGPIG